MTQDPPVNSRFRPPSARQAHKNLAAIKAFMGEGGFGVRTADPNAPFMRDRIKAAYNTEPADPRAYPMPAPLNWLANLSKEDLENAPAGVRNFLVGMVQQTVRDPVSMMMPMPKGFGVVRPSTARPSLPPSAVRYPVMTESARATVRAEGAASRAASNEAIRGLADLTGQNIQGWHQALGKRPPLKKLSVAPKSRIDAFDAPPADMDVWGGSGTPGRAAGEGPVKPRAANTGEAPPRGMVNHSKINPREVQPLVYRGITAEEAESIIKTGQIKSRGDFSHSSEGTSFAQDVEMAESAVNFGRGDPAKVGKSNYVIEVSKGPEMVVDPRDFFPKAKQPVPGNRVTRAWRYDPDGSVHAVDPRTFKKLKP